MEPGRRSPETLRHKVKPTHPHNPCRLNREIAETDDMRRDPKDRSPSRLGHLAASLGKTRQSAPQAHTCASLGPTATSRASARTASRPPRCKGSPRAGRPRTTCRARDIGQARQATWFRLLRCWKNPKTTFMDYNLRLFVLAAYHPRRKRASSGSRRDSAGPAAGRPNRRRPPAPA